MNWAAAATTGFGLGLAYFGGLWVEVRRLRPGGAARLVVGRAARLGSAAVVFYGLLKTGGTPAALAGLAGLLLARWHLVRVIGRASDGR